MATLTLVIDKPREEIWNLVDSTLDEHKSMVSVDFGHLSENGQHVLIEGEKADLEELKAAFEEKGETASIHE